jgi:hypothetical protein
VWSRCNMTRRFTSWHWYTIGFGTYLSPIGEKYIGHWSGGKKHGKGRYHFKNGDFYDGDFEYDRAEVTTRHKCRRMSVFLSSKCCCGFKKCGPYVRVWACIIKRTGTFTVGNGNKINAKVNRWFMRDCGDSTAAVSSDRHRAEWS